MKQNSLKGWFKSGAPGVWISGGAVSIAVIMTIGLLAVIAVRGLGHFWPADLIHASYNVPGMPAHLVVGEVVQKESVPRERLKSAGLPVPDEGPAPRDQLDQPGSREHPQRFPQRGARDAEAGGQLHLVEAFAILELAFHDSLFDRLPDFIGTAARHGGAILRHETRGHPAAILFCIQKYPAPPF